ncbi:hypothetical protein [Vibrio cholerae]|uniref:hypothetical protein n=1 Tax=Vibrio cholerae TaxID=666 RepID=UPI00227200C5|nr:hypothetical protein [Vibrio cholerae]MCX9568107.1 hypothetical protein [Vibrio cholerae]MCX9571551.1 hypothetical protein [Vibrio cholerae]MCX9589059.1 hypothetical protein [Vibrio cholerae]
MNLFLKRLSIYWLCFFVSYMPYRQAQAVAPAVALAGAVVLDIVAGAVIDKLTGDVSVPAVCGKKPWAANDPVFLCDARSPKSTWLGKVKTSAKWSVLLLAAGYILQSDSAYKSDSPIYKCAGTTTSNFNQCHSWALSVIKLNFPSPEYKILSVTPVYLPLGGFNRINYHIVTSKNGQSPVLNTAIVAFDVTGFLPTTPDDLYNDFWQTSPVVTPDTWLPEAAPAPQYHPDPGWFPSSVPVSVPMTPSPKPENDPTTYPKPLPSTHPDSRPSTTPKPDYTPDYWPPGDPLPGSWPSGWPKPGEITSPGEFPQEWPLPGSTPLPKPGTNPNPDPDPNPNPNPDPLPFPIPLPVIGPITREEFRTEQQNLWNEAGNALPDGTSIFQAHEQAAKQAMDTFIQDNLNPEIPEFQFSPFGYFSFGGGSCIGFTSNVSMGKISGQIVFDKHCQPWETIFRPPLEWALYLSTALYIYILFSRTVRSV